MLLNSKKRNYWKRKNGSNGKMKYIEEIIPGDVFTYKNDHYVLSTDFKQTSGQNKHMAVSIKNGTCRWFESNIVVDKLYLFFQDNDKNLVALKEYTNELMENQNIL